MMYDLTILSIQECVSQVRYAAFLKKVVQSGSLLTHFIRQSISVCNYEAKGRELYLTPVERNTIELLQGSVSDSDLKSDSRSG